MFGSHTKSLHPGRAAQNGLLSALLAAEDFTSSTSALEAQRGWANAISDQHKLDEQLATLGGMGKEGKWEIVRNAFKPFPCGIVVHPVIDGCIQLHELVREGIEIERVVSVEVKVHPLVVELTGKTKPRDGLEGKFSVYHGGAVGLVFGKATPAQYEDDVVRDSRVVSVRERITVHVDGAMRADECRVEVRLDNVDGDVRTVHVTHAVGSLERPMTDEQLTEKFVDQCLPVLGRERTEKASRWCWGLEKVVDVRCIEDVL
jgi:aconitate decarboxylase